MTGPAFSPKTLRNFTIAAVLTLGLGLSACFSGPKEAPDDFQTRPVEELYNEALDVLKEGLYDIAAKRFDEVERQHPYSIWATKAQLMAAYANYLAEFYDDAIVALDRFIQLHPSNKDTPYAYYLKGLSYYEQISDVGRDQRMTDQARQTLRELINRYPDSKYARDAQLKMELTEDHLAGKEMEIGRYYLSRNQCLAAINRFKAVVDHFQTTTHVPEALHRMTECYISLGMEAEAQKTAALLGHNFPGSEWYIDSFQIVERKRVRDKEEAPWYWPFEEEDALDVLNKAEGKPAASTRALSPDDDQAAPETNTDTPWYKFW